jgi:hypothetical protein
MSDGDRVSFLGARCPGGFRRRTLTLQPQDALDYLRADWLDTVVIVERGELELECGSGSRASFSEGAVLVLCGVGVRRLRNSGTTTLVLSALSRTGPLN